MGRWGDGEIQEWGDGEMGSRKLRGEEGGGEGGRVEWGESKRRISV